MTHDPKSTSPSIFHQVEVSASAPAGNLSDDSTTHRLLRDILASLDRQNELFEEMIAGMNATQRQRGVELKQWRQANPQLASECREAAATLSQIQGEYLRKLTEEVREKSEDMLDGEFLLNEFVDRFGPRLAHLNGVLQVLSQLSGPNNAEE